MAHGEFYARAFIGVALGYWIAFWFFLCCPAADAADRLCDRAWLIQRVFHSGERHVTTLLLTFGLGLVLEDCCRWCSDPTRCGRRRLSGRGRTCGIFLPTYRLFLIVIGLRHRGSRWSSIARGSARWCAPRLRPQHGGIARRAGEGSSTPAPSPSASRSLVLPACCSARSIRCFRPWGGFHLAGIHGGHRRRHGPHRRARSSPGCCSRRCRRLASLYISPVWSRSDRVRQSWC